MSVFSYIVLTFHSRVNRFMLYSDFKYKEVINIRDCRRLGHVINLEFNECTGEICKIMVPGKGKWFQIFLDDHEIVIPYNHIKQIGPDIILVEL